MSKEEQKEIVGKLLKEFNEIHKKGLAKANYIHLSAKLIQERADEEGVTFDEMVKIIEKATASSANFTWKNLNQKKEDE